MKINPLRNPRAFRVLPSFLTTWGWWNLALDLLSLKKSPYRFGRRMLRPNTTDCMIYGEVLAGQSYAPALPYIKTAQCVVDVGANVGFFAEWIRANNSGTKIHLFEPLSTNAERCVLDAGMVLHRDAVADFKGTLPVSVDAGTNYGSSHLDGGHFASPAAHPPITVVDARDLFELCQTKVIDVLKLDCEGAELGILRRINLAAVRCVIFEFHHAEELPALRQTLEQNQFQIQSEDTYHRVIYAVNTQPPAGK